MNIKIQVMNDTLPNAVRQRIRRRINKLNTFSDDLLSAVAILKQDGNNALTGKYCEIRLMIKGYDLFSRGRAPGFEEAASLAVESIRRQLIKRKTQKEIERRKNRTVFHGV